MSEHPPSRLPPRRAAQPTAPSVFGAVVLSLLGGGWLAMAVRWTARQMFHWKEHGQFHPVTPDSNPIAFWSWIAFSFAISLIILGRGLVEFYRWWTARMGGGHR